MAEMNRGSIDDVLSDLKREPKWQDHRVDPRSLQIKSGNPCTMTVKDLGEFPLTDSAMVTLCKLFRIPFLYLARFPVEGEFTEHANTWFQRSSYPNVLLRIRDQRIHAVLPHKYVVFDNVDFFEHFGPAIKQLGAFECTSNGINRVQIGEPLNSKDPIYLMLRFVNSEVGLHNFQMTIGNTRLSCGNDLIRRSRQYGYMNWSHSGNFEKVLNSIGSNITIGVKKAEILLKAMEDARHVKFGKSIREALEALVERGRIGNATKKKIVVGEQNPAGMLESKFDYVNLLTSKAQIFNSLETRARLEDLAARELIGEA